MNKLMVLLFTCFLTIATPSFGQIIFYDDAEDSPNYSRDWILRNEGNQFSVSSEKARAGNKSYKFSLAPYGTVSGNRSELVLRGLDSVPQISNFLYKREYWMGYSIYIPSNLIFPYVENDWALSGQFHDAPDECDNHYANPLFAMYPKSTNGVSGVFDITVKSKSDKCNNLIYDRSVSYKTPALVKGAWSDVVINFKFNYTSDGGPFMKVWLNGNLVVDDSGPNCYNDTLGPFFRMGLYGNTRNWMTVYYDEIRVGNETSSYIEVAPRGSQIINESSSLEAPTLRIVP